MLIVGLCVKCNFQKSWERSSACPASWLRERGDYLAGWADQNGQDLLELASGAAVNAVQETDLPFPLKSTHDRQSVSVWVNTRLGENLLEFKY